MFDTTLIDNYFPLKQYRRYQREAIKGILEAFNSGIECVLLDAPTGAGKSAIGYTVSQFFNSSFWITNSKLLQDQLTGDFGEEGKHIGDQSPLIDLKGRNAYPCNYWTRQLNDPDVWKDNKDKEKRDRYIQLSQQTIGCDKGQCKRDGKSKLKYCVTDEVTHCPYFIQMYKAQASKVCLMNYHSFLFQTSVVPNFANRDLLLLDEAHNAEDVLLQFIELKISDRHFATINVKFPEFSSVSEYVKYFEEICLEDLIVNKIKLSKMSLNSKEEDEWKHQLLRYNILRGADPSKWVCIWEEVSSGASRTITLKPIFVDQFAQEHLFSKARYSLLMSATLLSKKVICDALGIKDESKILRLRSTFPKENRPLYYRPVGSMSFKNKSATLPNMITDIEFICRHHQNERGVIHTHTFEITRSIIDNCAKDVRSRLLYQNDQEFNGDRKKMIEKHKQSENTILIAPALHEGLDLKDEFGRFQILCKVPYPSKGDPQVAARMELSSGYYEWKTACKLVQSTGRIVRHEEDYGVTYILDEDFRRFFRNTEDILPSWFKEAVIWD